MPHDPKSVEFDAEQVAGSLRIEGIPVSKEDELLMRDIIEGKVDPKALEAELIQNFIASNEMKDASNL